MTTTMTTRRYHLDELKARTHLTDSELATRIGITERHLNRLKTAGLTHLQADRYAIACGWHPNNIWPNWDDSRDHDVTPLTDHGT